MGEVQIPLTFDDLPTKPPLIGSPRISEDIQQTLALLSGWDESTRRLIRVSPTGVLYVCSPRAKAVWNVVAGTGDYTVQGSLIPTSEILIKAFATNVGIVMFNVSVAASETAGYPLSAGEWINISLNNLINLHLFIKLTGEKVAVIYTQ